MGEIGKRVVRLAERALGNVGVAAHRRPLITLGAVLLVTGVSLIGTNNIVLNTDLTALLPDTFQSVKDLDKLRERFGGVGYCVVIGRNGEDSKALERFAEDIAPKIEALPNVRFVLYKRPLEFFEQRALYFLDAEDLTIIADRLEEREKWERQNANPLYLDLEEIEQPSLDFPELKKKYAGKADASKWVRSSVDSNYYLDDKNRIVALMAKPSQFASDLGYARKVVEEIRSIIPPKEELKKLYGPEMEVHYAGRFAKRVDQQILVERDLSVASTVAMILVVLYLMLHFRRALAVVLIVAPLLVGLLWTFASAYHIFGNLNILTAFIGVILLGLGIDHGIHLLGRYSHEHAVQSDKEEAMRRTFGQTGRAVAVAAVTTTVAFIGVAASEFRAFHEFGTIAAVGMIAVVIAYTVCLPALLGLAHRFGWKPRDVGAGKVSSYAARLRQLAPRLLIGAAVVLVIAIFTAPRASFNFDFGALQGMTLLSYRLDKQVDHLLGYSQIPIVVLTDTTDEERHVVKSMRQRDEELDDESLIDFVIASTDLVPENQEAKIDPIRRIGAVVERVKPRWIERKHRRHLKTVKAMTKTDPFTDDDLPIDVHRQLRGPDAKPGSGFVLIFPSISLENGREIRELAAQVRGVEIEGGQQVSGSGEAMILADILEMIDREALPVLVTTAIAVFLTLLILLGNVRDAVLCLTPAVLTLLLTLGLLPLIDLKVNYLNMIMIPVIFGIAVDGGAHIVTRVRAGASLEETVDETGRAIAGAILTTALGFGAMTLAHQPGLRSVGELAATGLAANLLICLVALPALLAWLQKRREAKDSAQAARSVA